MKDVRIGVILFLFFYVRDKSEIELGKVSLEELRKNHIPLILVQAAILYKAGKQS
jgi:hypothetical protein